MQYFFVFLRRRQDVSMTCLQTVLKKPWRRLEKDVLQARLQDVLEKRNVC